jgi:hypothetical protein
MSDIAHEGARQPLRPWQYIMVVAAVIGAIAVLWFFLRGGVLWHHDKPKPIERSAGSGSVPAFVGPPDLQEAAAKQAAVSRPVSAGLPPVDESADFNAPLMSPTQQQSHMPPLTEPRQVPTDPSLAMANAIGGGSLLLPKAVAYRVPHPEFTIRKGTLIPCADVTAIDTGSGGNVLVKAVVNMDVWGMGHKIVLMEKGTELIGEVGHGMVNGLDRLGVVWREATTPWPNAVGISLDSPAAGPLGEGGLNGDVNRHEWQKVKGIVMLSLLQGSLSIAQALAQRHDTTNIDFSAVTNGGNEIGNTLLQSTINIPDTIHRDQGLACSAFLARDLDFYRVYGARIVQ